MNQMTVSVIIPIHNVEKYLRQCLDSVTAQSYANLEIIIVDDNSIDSSAKIADEYARCDNRVQIIRKPENDGANMARATGFTASSSELVTFVDSDDVLSQHYVADMVEQIERTDSDIIMSGSSFIDEDAKPVEVLEIQDVSYVADYSRDEIVQHFLLGFHGWKHNTNLTSICSKLYRRNLIEHYDWKSFDYKVGEDEFWSLHILNRASKVTVINRINYYIRLNQKSQSRSGDYTYKFQDRTISAFDICNDFMNCALKLLPDSFRDAIYFRTYFLYKHFIVNTIQKGIITVDDIAKFDNYFPLEQVKALNGYPIDNELIDDLSVNRGGLLLHLGRSITRRLDDINHFTNELSELRSELESYRSVKKSIQLVLQNLKKRLFE
jgi:glycosyltransferase involved in cell wall biosynthesis